MAKTKSVRPPFVVGGVDTHKDLHVAAVVDENNRVLGSDFFATTRQGYRQMLTWMASFGTVARIGVECTGSYGAGLLRHLQNAGITVLEVTAPDKMERRRRGKSDTIDAESAAHAAFSLIRTVTPKEGANKQVISSQADSLIKISRIWADFFPANNRISLFRLFFPPFLALFPVFTEISPTDVSFGPPETGWPG